MEKEYINLKEAAELLGVDIRIAKKIIQSNNFHYTRLKRRFLIKKDELYDFIKKNQNIRY